MIQPRCANIKELVCLSLIEKNTVIVKFIIMIMV